MMNLKICWRSVCDAPFRENGKSHGFALVWLTQGTFLRIRCWMCSVWKEYESLLIQTRFCLFKTSLQSPGSSVNIVNRQRARQSRNYLSIPGWSNSLSLPRVHGEYTSQTFSCILGEAALSLELLVMLTRESGDPRQRSDGVKNERSYISTTPMPSWPKHRIYLYFTTKCGKDH
jgi:hypothetical protein